MSAADSLAPPLSRRRLALRWIAGPELAFAGLLGLGAAIVLYETRGFSLYFDDWDLVLNRRGVSAGVLLGPHGPHLVLLPILVYKALLSIFGGSSFLPLRFLAAFDVVVMGLALGLVTRRLWGRWWGLVPVLLLVTLGSGAWSLLWSFQVGYALANAAGLLAIVLLSCDRRHANLIACGALIFSLASGSQGIGFLVAAVVVLLLRGNWRRSAWVVVVPAVLYGLWYAKYGHQASETSLSLWRGTLPYMMTGFSSTISGLLGLGSPSSDLPPQLDPSFGEPIALAALGVLAFALWRGWRPPRLFWAALVTLAVLLLATSLSNQFGARRPTDSRYLSTNAILLLVCICSVVSPPALRTGGRVAAVIGVAVIGITNAGQFTPMRDQMLATGVASRAQLGALLVMRGVVGPAFAPAPPFSTGLLNDVRAGTFFSAYDDFGGLPVDSVAQLLHQSERARQLADQVLQRGEELGYAFTTAHAPPGPPPVVIAAHAQAQGSCLVLGGGFVTIRATPGTVYLTASPRSVLHASAGRFATNFDLQFGVVPAGRTASLHFPEDRAPAVSWRLLVTGGGRVCS